MWWRPSVIRWTVLACAVTSIITTILVTLMLLPAMTDGPGAVHFLERRECILHNITYRDNRCPRESSNDFSNLVYREDWLNCKIILFNSTTDTGVDCHWFHPGNYQTEESAFITVSENFREGLKYDCVLDTIKNICYPDKKEILIFSLSVTSLFVLSCILICIFFYIKLIYEKK